MYVSASQLYQVAVICFISAVSRAQDSLNDVSFIDNFRRCKMGSRQFDNCIRDGLNAVRPFFKLGVPELKLPPFDPFHSNEIVQVRGQEGFNYRLVLRNITESGWTQSTVTSFKSDPRQQFVRYTQYFPEKYLQGAYEFEGQVMSRQLNNRGLWNLTLFDLVQTTTISRLPKSNKLKVYVDVLTINNLELHATNLLPGRYSFANNVLDSIINRTWRPFFRMIRPLINDLVSTGFTEIFNNAFSELDINRILGNNDV